MPIPTPPSAADAGIEQFPVSVKVRTDTLNPAIAPMAPETARDVAASIAQAPVPNPSPAKPAPNSEKKTKSGHVPPVKLPAKPAAAKLIELAPRETILTGHSAGPKMPVVRPASILAEPLDDPLARQLVQPSKQQMLDDIEAVANRQGKPADVSPSAILPAAALTQVRTPAEALNPMAQPQTAHVATAGEKGFLTLPARRGATDLDAGTIAELTSRVLPVLAKNLSWQARVDAYASSVSDEPLNARRIALSRALAVRGWLIDHGVLASRLTIRAFGPETGHSPPDQTEISFVAPPGAR